MIYLSARIVYETSLQMFCVVTGFCLASSAKRYGYAGEDFWKCGVWSGGENHYRGGKCDGGLACLRSRSCRQRGKGKHPADRECDKKQWVLHAAYEDRGQSRAG